VNTSNISQVNSQTLTNQRCIRLTFNNSITNTTSLSLL